MNGKYVAGITALFSVCYFLSSPALAQVIKIADGTAAAANAKARVITLRGGPVRTNSFQCSFWNTTDRDIQALYSFGWAIDFQYERLMSYDLDFLPRGMHDNSHGSQEEQLFGCELIYHGHPGDIIGAYCQDWGADCTNMTERVGPMRGK